MIALAEKSYNGVTLWHWGEHLRVLEKSLADWFAWMDDEKWATKWPSKMEDNVTKRLIQHSTWTEQSDIAFTPTFFLNGRKIPGRYGLEDIAWLVPQLAEIMKEHQLEL